MSQSNQTLAEQVAEATPRWYPGKRLTEQDVRDIEWMHKHIKALEGAVRDYSEERKGEHEPRE